MKHHLLDSRPPTHFVPRIIALPNPSAAPRSFVKLEHVLPIVRLKEQPADASFCDMDWPLAALVSRPLLLHLRQHPLPVATVAPEVVHEDHVLAVGFGHELDCATDEPKSVTSGRESQSWRSWPSAGMMSPRGHGREHLPPSFASMNQ